MNTPEYDDIIECICPQDDEDTVTGHVAPASSAATLLRCWDCRGVFEITGAVRSDIFYVCTHCRSLNQPDPSRSGNAPRNPAPDRIRGPFQPPVVLDTVFMAGVDGELYEMSRSDAERFRVTHERRAELGHGPYVLDRDEVGGHHKLASGDGSSLGEWSYHRTWEHGCYFDEALGGFAIGFHHHPYGDERAIGALESDFA